LDSWWTHEVVASWKLNRRYDYRYSTSHNKLSTTPIVFYPIHPYPIILKTSPAVGRKKKRCVSSVPFPSIASHPSFCRRLSMLLWSDPFLRPASRDGNAKARHLPFAVRFGCWKFWPLNIITAHASATSFHDDVLGAQFDFVRHDHDLQRNRRKPSPILESTVCRKRRKGATGTTESHALTTLAISTASRRMTLLCTQKVTEAMDCARWHR
jgi:hypothetical protein